MIVDSKRLRKKCYLKVSFFLVIQRNRVKKLSSILTSLHWYCTAVTKLPTHDCLSLLSHAFFSRLQLIICIKEDRNKTNSLTHSNGFCKPHLQPLKAYFSCIWRFFEIEFYSKLNKDAMSVILLVLCCLYA